MAVNPQYGIPRDFVWVNQVIFLNIPTDFQPVVNFFPKINLIAQD